MKLKRRPNVQETKLWQYSGPWINPKQYGCPAFGSSIDELTGLSYGKSLLEKISVMLRVLTSLAYPDQTLDLCMHFLFRPIEIDLGQSASALLNLLRLGTCTHSA